MATTFENIVSFEQAVKSGIVSDNEMVLTQKAISRFLKAINGIKIVRPSTPGFVFNRKDATTGQTVEYVYKISTPIEPGKAIYINKQELEEDVFLRRLTKAWAANLQEQTVKTHNCTKCAKCEGKGEIQEFKHRDFGVCYDCLGTGIRPQSKR